MVAEGGAYPFYINQGNKSYKERRIGRKKLSFMHTKRFNKFLGAIPRKNDLKLRPCN